MAGIKIVKDGNRIISIENEHTGLNRDIILVTENVDINGQLVLDGNRVYLGYNETITCYTPEIAEEVFDKIADVMMGA